MWALLIVVAVAPGTAHAEVRAATTVAFPSSVVLGERAVPASITLRNANTGPDFSFANLVCNGGDASPPCSPSERGIVHVPSCTTITAQACAPGDADPGTFVLAPTGVGRSGSACSGVSFEVVALGGTAAFVFRPLPSSAYVRLPGSGSQCVIDFTFDVLNLPSRDADPSMPGEQTAQATSHTQRAEQLGSGSDTAQATDVTTVRRAAPSIATLATPDIGIGAGDLSDTATVSGRVNRRAGATIDFRLYGPDDADCSNAAVFESLDVPYPGAGGAVSSAAFTPTRAGTYRWVARYSGDANNEPAVGGCGDPDETRVVSRAIPSLATVASPDVVLGAGTLSDQATVSGRVNPLTDATVQFRLYGPDDADCAGPPVFEALDVSYPVDGGAVGSTEFTPTQAGTYRWVASYSGDANNTPIASSCLDSGQSTVVAPPIPPPTPPPSDPAPPQPQPPTPPATPATEAPSAPVRPSPSPGSLSDPTPIAPSPDPAPGATSPEPPQPPSQLPDAAPAGVGAVPAAPPTPEERPRPARPRAAQRQAPPLRARPRAAPAERPIQEGFAPYDPRSDPERTMGILVAALILMQLAASARGLARRAERRTAAAPASGAARGAQADAPEFEGGYEGVDVQFLGAGLGIVARGDQSRTWGWPGTERLDRVSYALPARLSRRSPLLARVVADGTYLRAILGSASLLTLLGGLVLGLAAVQNTGGEVLPPAVVLTIAIAVLGVIDAAAGLLAVLIFAVGVVALGGVGSAAELRLLLGLGAMWFVVPLLAGAARPLRRPPTRGLEESWERAADFVIASLVGAWAVQQLVLALPGLAGLQLPIAEHANTAAYCVLATLVCRLAFETVTAHLYPRRLDRAEPAELPAPGPLQRALAGVTRTVIFVFFAYIIVGASWQLWVSAALFLIPQLLALLEDHLPNSPRLFGVLPKGLVELVLMTFVVTAFAALLFATMNEDSETFLANSFVLLALPGFLLSLLGIFGREGEERELGWGKRFAGLGVLVAGVLLTLGVLL